MSSLDRQQELQRRVEVQANNHYVYFATEKEKSSWGRETWQFALLSHPTGGGNVDLKRNRCNGIPSDVPPCLTTQWLNMLVSLFPVTLLFFIVLMHPEALFFPRLFNHLIIYRAHRKQLVTMILQPSTMQWIPFRIYRWRQSTLAPLHIQDLGLFIQQWIYTMYAGS